MADFVLVHGAWHGAWCWKKILPGLWGAGHRAFAVTLSGVGERVHQLSPQIRLRTHADDVAAVIEAEELQHAIVVGHARRQAIARTGTVPPADPALFGLQGEDADWVRRRQTPQPGGVYDDPLQFEAGVVASLPRTFIACTQPPLATIAASLRRARAQPGWQMLEIATGHDAMISAPQALLQHLLALS